MLKITVKSVYDGLPIVMSEEGKIYQLNYYDRLGRFRKYKLLDSKLHNGSLYYRICGKRYSEYKLQAIEIKSKRKINLDKKVIKWKK